VLHWRGVQNFITKQTETFDLTLAYEKAIAFSDMVMASRDALVEAGLASPSSAGRALSTPSRSPATPTQAPDSASDKVARKRARHKRNKANKLARAAGSLPPRGAPVPTAVPPATAQLPPTPPLGRPPPAQASRPGFEALAGGNPANPGRCKDFTKGAGVCEALRTACRFSHA